MPSLAPHGQLADARVCVILSPRLEECGSHVDGVWGEIIVSTGGARERVHEGLGSLENMSRRERVHEGLGSLGNLSTCTHI